MGKRFLKPPPRIRRPKGMRERNRTRSVLTTGDMRTGLHESTRPRDMDMARPIAHELRIINESEESISSQDTG
jgi:hypothetical protein